MELIKLIFLH